MLLIYIAILTYPGDLKFAESQEVSLPSPRELNDDTKYVLNATYSFKILPFFEMLL